MYCLLLDMQMLCVELGDVLNVTLIFLEAVQLDILLRKKNSKKYSIQLRCY